jgi:hypothetical protein
LDLPTTLFVGIEQLGHERPRRASTASIVAST